MTDDNHDGATVLTDYKPKLDGFNREALRGALEDLRLAGYDARQVIAEVRALWLFDGPA